MAHMCLGVVRSCKKFHNLGPFACEIMLWGFRSSFRSCEMGFEGCEMAHVCLEGGSNLRNFSQLGSLACER